jgi:hypothetical protein
MTAGLSGSAGYPPSERASADLATNLNQRNEIMAERSDIIAHLSNGTWARIYCHWNGRLEHNGRTLFEHYADQEKVEQLVKLGCLSKLGQNIGRKHKFESPPVFVFEGDSAAYNPAYLKWLEKTKTVCTAYVRDRGMGVWHPAVTKEQFLADLGPDVGDTLFAVWPKHDSWTEFTYVWCDAENAGRPRDPCWWVVAAPRKGPQHLANLADALQNKITVRSAVEAFGAGLDRGANNGPWSAA